MTIIVAMQGVMVADSGEFQGAIMRRVHRPKIVRNDQGWLAAWSGNTADGMLFEKWFLARMAEEDRPILSADTFAALMMAPDGAVWRVDKPLISFRMDEPAICGEETAESFVLGAIMAGASPQKAVKLACDHCVWVTDPVQVEGIQSSADFGSVIEVRHGETYDQALARARGSR